MRIMSSVMQDKAGVFEHEQASQLSTRNDLA